MARRRLGQLPLTGQDAVSGDQALLDKSVAVLPFVSLAQDVSQEYFADGITENILIQLASLRHLRVISTNLYHEVQEDHQVSAGNCE